MSNKIIRNIPLEDIEENPLNQDIFNMDDIERLAGTIKEEGFSGSIDVVELENGKYQIYSGHRRFRAVKLLGWDRIPCTIEGNIKDTMLIRRLLSSNIQTRKMRPLDYANAIKAYEHLVLDKEKFKGNRRKEKARFFGMSESQIRRYELMLDLIPELQTLTNEPSFPYVALIEALTLTEDQQKELATIINFDLRKYKEEFGISAQMVKNCINSIKKREEMRREAEEEALRRERLFEEEQFDEVDGENIFSFVREIEDDSEDYSDVLSPVSANFQKTDNHLEAEKEEPHKLTKQEKESRRQKLMSSIDIDLIQMAAGLREATEKGFEIFNEDSVRQTLDEIKIYIRRIEEKV